MTRFDRLQNLLEERYPDARIQLFDDSAAHADHQVDHGTETHYRVHVYDASFMGRSTLAIHREILTAIKPELDQKMHSFVFEKVGVD